LAEWFGGIYDKYSNGLGVGLRLVAAIMEKEVGDGKGFERNLPGGKKAKTWTIQYVDAEGRARQRKGLTNKK
jgi:hypothetical protein